MPRTIERCGCEAAPEAWFEIGEAANGVSGRAWLMRCPVCGSLRPEPPPRSADAYLDYYTRAAPRGGWRRWARVLANLTRRAYLDRATPPNARRVLDVGCGSGAFLRRIARPGRDRFGTDPLEPADSGGDWTWLGTDAFESAAPYDWITLGHVLEHLDDPAGVVERLVASLAPDGGLWIATPNAESFLFASAGRAARDVDYPRHLQIFSRVALMRLLGAAGLSVRFVSPPRLNAVLNTLATAGALAREGRALRLVRTLGALAVHLAGPRGRRDLDSPELIAICRLNRATPSPAR